MNQYQVTKMIGYSVGLMILTSIHHIYGAIIYRTPWRLHVLMLSIPVILLTLLCSRMLKKNVAGSFFFWVLVLITLIPSVALIGFYEGVYNHVFKNLMFFGGADTETLRSLFPPPKYEMPNDLLFELTGVLQGLIVFPLAIALIKAVTAFFRKN